MILFCSSMNPLDTRASFFQSSSSAISWFSTLCRSSLACCNLWSNFSLALVSLDLHLSAYCSCNSMKRVCTAFISLWYLACCSDHSVCKASILSAQFFCANSKEWSRLLYSALTCCKYASVVCCRCNISLASAFSTKDPSCCRCNFRLFSSSECPSAVDAIKRWLFASTSSRNERTSLSRCAQRSTSVASRAAAISASTCCSCKRCCCSKLSSRNRCKNCACSSCNAHKRDSATSLERTASARSARASRNTSLGFLHATGRSAQNLVASSIAS
mmetsp:Transcript_43996/g.70323  ORF Transcript_43996/g.70323 Transcript_43996/m.70323 type:complete len:273 (+) Transcript_43996:204-1022(+)